MKKDKKEARFKRKINAICIDFRFYSRTKKATIIDPCLIEYRKKVSSGLSSKEATKEIAGKCQDTLERKHEKHNKFLSLMLFCIAFCAFIFLIEAPVYSLFFAFTDANNVNNYIIWSAVIIALVIGFIIFLCLTRSGRFFHYIFLGIIVSIYLVMGIIYIYFGYFEISSECRYIQDIDYLYNPFIFTIKNSFFCYGTGATDINNISMVNLDTWGSVLLVIVALVLYFIEYYKLNHYYPRNDLSNLSTEYGKTTKAAKDKIRREGLQFYYSQIDMGLTKKDAYELTMNRYTNEFSIGRVKNNRFLSSLIIISTYFVLILIYSLIYVIASSYTAWCGGLLGFILGVSILLFIIMLCAYNHFYWYDFVFVAVMIILLLVEIITIVQLPDHVDTAGGIYYQSYFPLYNVEVVERATETILDDGSILQDIFKVDNYIIPSYNMMGAIIMALIVVPLFCINHYRNKDRY